VLSLHQWRARLPRWHGAGVALAGVAVHRKVPDRAIIG